ncbi:peptide ABC transporter substrate-binding protein [Brevibacillus massiliensis]|uniref:peptide ABC transporter substrate-binding protein n=1 Tax=Brevibacillus massiliensis TaxID=1118054 RepID=UPI0002DB6772|nr:peptide ABC transporter substrate-binding protein [Brevibacillus massiliensis]
MKKNVLVLASSIMILGAALAGCGSAPAGDSAAQSSAQAGSTGGKDLRINIPSEPPTIDPGLAEDSTSNTVIKAIFDGLYRLDQDGKPQPSVAEGVDVSTDGLTYTFHLRDTKWSNGDPVTAKDFEFAWKRALDPKTASNYAYQLYYLKNGEAFNKGQAKADDVGVKAKDDKTLVVTLENPTPFFLELTAFTTYLPVDQKVVEANPKWANEADTIVSNGPFKMDTWEHKSKITLSKNDNYWDKDVVKLDKIQMSMIDADDTVLNMFDNGELDWAGAPLNSLPTDAIPALKDAGRLHIYPVSSVYWYKFNTEKPPFNNAKIRKAFAYAINRQAIIDNLLQADQKPALGAVPTSMSLNPQGYFKDNDVETAKKLLAEGMQELGIDKLPPITLSYNTNQGHQQIAQAVQDQWKKNLGVDVKLENQEWKVYIDSLHQGNYQIGRMGWNADFNDPMTFLDAFKEKNGGNNDTRWENPKYKELLDQALKEVDIEKRKALMKEAEQILMDEMPVVPIYFYTSSYVANPNLKGVVTDPFNHIDFKWASLE